MCLLLLIYLTLYNSFFIMSYSGKLRNSEHIIFLKKDFFAGTHFRTEECRDGEWDL